jgi:hypothetical protein
MRIGLTSDPSSFAKVKSITSPTELVLYEKYPGVPGASGAWGTAAFIEGVGGHYIAGSSSHDDFIIDYYPELIKKMRHVLPRIMTDETSLVFTTNQAKDRGYIILNEVIRLYRHIVWTGAFEPRLSLYKSVRLFDNYRPTNTEEFIYLVEKISLSDSSAVVAGTEYGAGVLR